MVFEPSDPSWALAVANIKQLSKVTDVIEILSEVRIMLSSWAQGPVSVPWSRVATSRDYRLIMTVSAFKTVSWCVGMDVVMTIVRIRMTWQTK